MKLIMKTSLFLLMVFFGYMTIQNSGEIIDKQFVVTEKLTGDIVDNSDNFFFKYENENGIELIHKVGELDFYKTEVGSEYISYTVKGQFYMYGALAILFFVIWIISIEFYLVLDIFAYI